MNKATSDLFFPVFIRIFLFDVIQMKRKVIIKYINYLVEHF